MYALVQKKEKESAKLIVDSLESELKSRATNF